MDDYEIIDKLTKRVIEYLKINLGIDKVEEDFFISDVDTLEYHCITTFISLSGDITGTVGLSVSHKLATILVEHSIFGEIDKKLIEELTIQTTQEILNITLGNIIKELNIVKNGGKVEISTPYTLDKKDYPTQEKYTKIYSSKIKYSDEDIILSYFYR